MIFENQSDVMVRGGVACEWGDDNTMMIVCEEWNTRKLGAHSQLIAKQ